MQIDGKMISHLEDLSCLVLSDGEKNRFTEDLQKIFDGIKKIKELDTNEVIECCSPLFDSTPRENNLRLDEVTASFDRNLILQNAAVKNDEFFIAPKTIE